MTPPVDPHEGGSLSDMAVNGTTMPNDAGRHNLIPSVPRPDQMEENPAYHRGFVYAGDLQTAADNAMDMPRHYRDIDSISEVITGTGDQLPAEIMSKNLHVGPHDPLAKNDRRYEKHVTQNRSKYDRCQGKGADIDLPPVEEELVQEGELTKEQSREWKGL